MSVGVGVGVGVGAGVGTGSVNVDVDAGEGVGGLVDWWRAGEPGARARWDGMQWWWTGLEDSGAR